MRKAYGRVTLIVDDAMRGLSELNERMVWLAIQAGVEVNMRDQDPDQPDPH